MSFNDEVPSPAELAEDYKSSLDDLSVNSRWEITNLTVIAKENIHAAQAISKVIEEHIQKTPPLRKLPALYLLDSIAKNVGTPYTLFFGKNLYRTFMDAYSLVESPVRRKLEEMLQTWKQPVPGSTSLNPLFPAETTRKIDNALIKARTAAVQQQQKQMKQDSARFGIGQPSVAAGAGAGPYRSTPTPPMLVNGHGQSGPFGPPQSQNFDARGEQASNRGTVSTVGQGTNLAALLSKFSKPQATPSPPSLPPNSSSAPPAAKNLFESLMSAGLLKSGGSTAQNTSGPKTANTLNVGLFSSGFTGTPTPNTGFTSSGFNVNWESLDVDLTSASLKVVRPQFVSILNDSLPNKCGSCARRFTNTEQGKKDKAAHLDWHFRVHQRIADSTKHAQFRSWYVGEEFREDEEDSSVVATSSNQQSTDPNAAAAATLEANTTNYITAPNDPALSNITCPVCKEKFTTVWHPDAEDWVLMDAVKSAGRIYHASCFAEISKENPAVSATVSRGSTPENSISKGKRKADVRISYPNTKLRIDQVEKRY
ncbi:hypothetical protein ABW20_dc0108487 [Dactylellina cionopaga]|nr:hypothetical protein ABW20_dc0108487 [Dactylellina cionopaga]